MVVAFAAEAVFAVVVGVLGSFVQLESKDISKLVHRWVVSLDPTSTYLLSIELLLGLHLLLSL